MFGYNKLEEKKENKILKFLGFMWNPFSWVMEATSIMAITMAQGGENNAGNAAAALMDRLAPKAKVLRNGKWNEEDASILVPGDIINIKLGYIIPSDGRLLEGDALKIDQVSTLSYFLLVGMQITTYDTSKQCKLALFTAFFNTESILGAIISVISGFFGMKIATYANARTALEARKGVEKAFIVAFHSGAVMGFLLAANGLLVLYITINLFKIYYGDDWKGLFEAITGYGLGSSYMALFGRVRGGIFTKVADVGAHLVGHC